MTILVPFDGSPIARAALRRATELAEAFDRQILVYAVVPDRRRYAERKGWIESGDDVDPEAIAERLRGKALSVAPEASFEAVVVGGEPSGGYIAKKIRDYARENDVLVLVLGSETVGRVVTPLTSVSRSVAAEQAYELYLVRSPTQVEDRPL
jgi:nucleotide-binding universal stress UspA family protein